MFPILLRLLLCLGLLVDAAAPVFAATRMATFVPDAARAMPVALAAGMDRADHGAATDCHTMREATPAPSEPAGPGDDDCLQRCLDLCLQHAFAAVATTNALPASGAVPAPALNLRTRAGAHPALPPLRPPIV